MFLRILKFLTKRIVCVKIRCYKNFKNCKWRDLQEVFNGIKIPFLIVNFNSVFATWLKFLRVIINYFKIKDISKYLIIIRLDLIKW